MYINEEAGGTPFFRQPHTYSCSICQRTDNLNGYQPKTSLLPIMRDRNVCYQCAFWIDAAQSRPLNAEIIGGVLYIANPFVHRPLHVIKGSFGKEFYIRKLDGTLLRVNNLWKVGVVPAFCREDFPDTAHFLSLMTYQKLSKDTHTCNAKGCWDRYHCLRYDLSNEKEGPFNIVPEKHRVGDEKCPSFIHFKELKTK